MDACTNLDILRVIWFFKKLLDIVKVIIPIGLIVLGLVDFSKAMISGDEKTQKNSGKLFGKRIIYAILVFAVPWFIDVFMVTLNELLGEEDEVNYADCWLNADEEYIEEHSPRDEVDTPGGTTTGVESCYWCPSTGEFIWNKGNPGSHCLSGWAIQDRNKNNCNKNNCYRCQSTGKYVWAESKPTESCPGGIGIGWELKSGYKYEDCGEKKCYFCAPLNKRYWGVKGEYSDTYCPNSWTIESGITDEGTCLYS